MSLPGPKEPWPSDKGDRGDGDEPEILGPDDPGPGGPGGSGGGGPWGGGPGGMRIRILSGGELKRYGMMGCGGLLAVAAYGLVMLFAAIIGLNAWLGFLGAVLGILLALLLRTSIPIMMGGFVCAYNVWGWSLFGSALFAAPMLVLAVPFLSWNLLRMVMRRRFDGR